MIPSDSNKSLKRETFLLPVNSEIFRQLSFAEPIKKENVRSVNSKGLIPVYKNKKMHHNFAHRKCPLLLCLTLSFIIFAIFQAILYSLMFSEWIKQSNNITSSCNSNTQNSITTKASQITSSTLSPTNLSSISNQVFTSLNTVTSISVTSTPLVTTLNSQSTSSTTVVFTDTTLLTTVPSTTIKLLYDALCISSDDCRVDLGLSCPSGICTCTLSNKYWNEISCVDLLKYNDEVCTNSTQCVSPMVCKLSGNSCNCPENVSNGKCDCPARSIGIEYYSNGITCLPAAVHGTLCSQDYECQYLTQSTSCNGTCQCDAKKYYNSATKKCENLVAINGSCSQVNACNSAFGLVCQNGVCICNSADKFWNGITCAYSVSYLRNELINAVVTNNVSATQFYIKNGANPNEVNPNTNTSLLMHASSFGYTDVVNELIKGGAKIDAQNINGATALIFASAGNHTDIVKLLLETNADPSLSDFNGNTPLLYAYLNNNYENVDALLKAGANTEIRYPSDYITLLYYAAYQGKPELVDMFIKANANPDALGTNKRSGLMVASQSGFTEITKKLLEAGANTDFAEEVNGDTALIFAVQNNHTEIVKLLIQFNANVNQVNNKNQSALLNAYSKNQLEIFEILLNANANPNSVYTTDNTEDKFTLAFYAAQQGKLDFVKLLIKANADLNLAVNAAMRTPLIEATIQGYTNIINALIVAGASLDAVEINGRTALMLASIQGFFDIADSLINANASLNLRDSLGHTALYYAEANGRSDVSNSLRLAGGTL